MNISILNGPPNNVQYVNIYFRATACTHQYLCMHFYKCVCVRMLKLYHCIKAVI